MHPTINFNDPNILNIFTDASVMKRDYGFDSCPMAIGVVLDSVEKSYVEILKNTTNNFGEMYGIYKGVLIALELLKGKQYTHINLFSDSLISVNGLKEWLFNWQITKEGILLNTSGEVKNQSIICNIINIILTFKSNISFYHTKGHSLQSKSVDLNKIKDEMIKLNKDNSLIMLDDYSISKILWYNDYVDKGSREYLKSNSKKEPELIYPIERRFNSNWDLREYRNLITPKY